MCTVQRPAHCGKIVNFVQSIDKLIPENRLTNLYIVLNGVEAKKGCYGYGYGYGYGNSEEVSLRKRLLKKIRNK